MARLLVLDALVLLLELDGLFGLEEQTALAGAA